MNNININKDYRVIFIIFYLTIGLIFPAFKHFTNIPAFYPSFFLFVLYILFYQKSILFSRTIIITFYFFIITIIYIQIDYYKFLFDYKIELFNRVFPFFIAGLLLEFLIKNNNKNFNFKLSRFVLILIFISAILTIFSEIFYPGSTRNFGKISYPKWVMPYSFGMVNAIPLVIMAVFTSNTKGNYKIYFLLFILILSVILSGFFTAMIFSIIVIFLGYFSKRKYNQFIVLILFSIFIIIIYSHANNIINLLKLAPNPVYVEKSQQLYKLLLYNTNPFDFFSQMRAGVYARSFRSILKNFLFGVGDYKYVGGHSFWLDKFGQLGFIGTMPYIVIIINLYLRAKLIIPKTYLKIYKSTFYTLNMLMLFNPFNYLDFWSITFVYVPLLINYFYYQKKI